MSEPSPKDSSKSPTFKPILVDDYEKVTDARLQETCSGFGARVCPKVGLKEVLPIEGSGLPSELFRYALQAHFDFVVADAKSIPLFAVEFDGASHRSEVQRRRDEKKNALCERFRFPILRINSRYLNKKYRGMDLLSWYVDVWFAAHAFFDAQEKGAVPWDEPFDPFLFVSWSDHKRRFPLWLTIEVQMEIQALREAGKCIQSAPSFIIGADDKDNCHALAWMKITPETGVYATTGMRNQLFPVAPGDALQQIVIFDLHHELRRTLSGEAQPLPWEQITLRIKAHQERYRLLRGCTVSG
ncbi:DUF2726 domain-containing protein [Sorangium sp. So ce1504]|uniref:DUF2726 domain-containing protein n=1 Tax=Sorangium sp. So ce1504 TaxID=3133337 RepID=UPI003F619D76